MIAYYEIGLWGGRVERRGGGEVGKGRDSGWEGGKLREGEGGKGRQNFFILLSRSLYSSSDKRVSVLGRKKLYRVFRENLLIQ